MDSNLIFHPYAQAVCKNKGELLYVLTWAEKAGKKVSSFMWEVEKFPYHLFLSGDVVGWTDVPDRIGEKIPFLKFVNTVTWVFTTNTKQEEQ